jgi:Zn finger protein HypA/HybF involved in hydrogenase expression
MCKRLTTEEFIEKAKSVHGDNYDYSETIYNGFNNKVRIFCNKYKQFFEQKPANHIKGQKYSKFDSNIVTDEFIEKAKSIHGDKFNYDKTIYLDSKSKIEIYCNKHNIYFLQSPYTHLKNKFSCPDCATEGKTINITKDEFIEKAKSIHGDKYNYDDVIYINSRIKIKIWCNIHNEHFLQQPNVHINQKCGCPKCGREISVIKTNEIFNLNGHIHRDNRKLTKETFIEKAKKLHGDKYLYDDILYLNNKTNIKIYCTIHNEHFEQTPKSHIKNNPSGCPKCSIFNRSIKVRLSDEEFILKINDKYGTDTFGFDKLIYVNYLTPVTLYCNKHNEYFNQTPKALLTRNTNCTLCGSENRNYLLTYTNEEFINMSKDLHGKDTYSYDKTFYTKSINKVILFCIKHNEYFNITPKYHLTLSKGGCPKCANENYHRITEDTIIERSKNIHGKNTFRYDKINYIKLEDDIKLFCNKHEIYFDVNSERHITQNQGCPLCSPISIGEDKINKFLIKEKIGYIKQKTFEGCKDKKLLKFDFYLPKYNICIEFDGKQHYEPIEFFGGKEGFIEIQKRDIIKNEYCKNNNIELIRILYYENIENKLTELLKLN